MEKMCNEALTMKDWTVEAEKVKTFIPLGSPRRLSVDGKESSHFRRHATPQRISAKLSQTKRSDNPLAKQAMPSRSPALELKGRVSVEKVCGASYNPVVVLNKLHPGTTLSISATGSALPNTSASCTKRGHGSGSSQGRSRSLEVSIEEKTPAQSILSRRCSTPYWSQMKPNSPAKWRPMSRPSPSLRNNQEGLPEEHGKQSALPVNSTGGSKGLHCTTTAKRKVAPEEEEEEEEEEEQQHKKRTRSVGLGQDARPSRDRDFKRQESNMDTKLSFCNKQAKQRSVQRAQDPKRDTKENKQVLLKTPKESAKYWPAQPLKCPQMQTSKLLAQEQQRRISGSMEDGQRDRSHLGCVDASLPEQPSVCVMDGDSRSAKLQVHPTRDIAGTDRSLQGAATVAYSLSFGKGNPSTLKAVVPDKWNPCANRNTSAACSPDTTGGTVSQARSPLGLDLDLELDLNLEDCTVNSSSDTSEDEPLLSLQEIMEHSACPPSTPHKDAYSEPSTPQGKIQPAALKSSRPVNYRNSLEQMLREKERNQRLKDSEVKLLLSCKENLRKVAEEETNEDPTEETMPQEQREFLQRFSVVSSVIPDLHPGEEVFILANFGRLFNLHTLDLRRCAVAPQNMAQKTLLRASSEQLPLLVSAGLLQKAYRSAPCAPAVCHWMFQMMSVHPDRKTSTQILKAMEDIALIAAEQTVLKQSTTFEVWTASVQEVALVFLNMGVPFVTLFPLESLQPPFSEGDILQSSPICTEQVQELKSSVFPQHNLENVIKYLALSTALATRAYSDQELLLLLTAVCKLSLETRVQLLVTEDWRTLLEHLLNNTREWDKQMARVCLALADLTEDHHNLRRLVQLLPHSKRGKQLRKHLSVTVISKLLDHKCTYTPTNTDFQLAVLQPFVPRMRPSMILKSLSPVTERLAQESCPVSLDQQAYYLCYNLLALINEATNFESLPLEQKKHLMILCAELEKYIKCDIRESEKCLYRSKVKDFVARIYTRWQVLLQKSRPLQGKLYDYWQPLPEDVDCSNEDGMEEENRVEEEENGMKEAEGLKEDKTEKEEDRVKEVNKLDREEEEGKLDREEEEEGKLDREEEEEGKLDREEEEEGKLDREEEEEGKLDREEEDTMEEGEEDKMDREGGEEDKMDEEEDKTDEEKEEEDKTDEEKEEEDKTDREEEMEDDDKTDGEEEGKTDGEEEGKTDGEEEGKTDGEEEGKTDGEEEDKTDGEEEDKTDGEEEDKTEEEEEDKTDGEEEEEDKMDGEEEMEDDKTDGEEEDKMEDEEDDMKNKEDGVEEEEKMEKDEAAHDSNVSRDGLNHTGVPMKT